nr:MAG TPA: hypothetical protein [Inoviridae sp.]
MQKHYSLSFADDQHRGAGNSPLVCPSADGGSGGNVS